MPEALNKRKTGTYYEGLAADYLTGQGLLLAEKNYRCPRGEIDLIFKDPRTDYLIFIEVKYRIDENSGNPLEAVNINKQRIISRCAQFFLYERYDNFDIPCRFDVIGIEGKEGEEKILWIQDAFDYTK